MILSDILAGTPSSGSDDISAIYQPGPGFPQPAPGFPQPGPGFPQPGPQLDLRFPQPSVRHPPVIPPVVPETTGHEGPFIPPQVFPQPSFPQPQGFPPPITVTTLPPQPPTFLPDRSRLGPVPDRRPSEGGPIFIPPDLGSLISRHSTGDPRPTSPSPIPRPHPTDLGSNVIEIPASSSSSGASSTDTFRRGGFRDDSRRGGSRRADSRAGESRRSRESYGSRPTSRSESGRRRDYTPSPRRSSRPTSRPLIVTNPSEVPNVVLQPPLGSPLEPPVHIVSPSVSPAPSHYEQYPEQRLSQVPLGPPVSSGPSHYEHYPEQRPSQVPLQPQPQPQAELPPTNIYIQPSPSQPPIIHRVPTSPRPSYRPSMSDAGTVHRSGTPVTPIVVAPSDAPIIMGPSGIPTVSGMPIAPSGMPMVPSGMPMAPSGMPMAPGMPPMAPYGMPPMAPVILESSSGRSSPRSHRSQHQQMPSAPPQPIIINTDTRRTPPPIQPTVPILPSVAPVSHPAPSSRRSRSPTRRRSSGDSSPIILQTTQQPMPMQGMPTHMQGMPIPVQGMPIVGPSGVYPESRRSSRSTSRSPRRETPSHIVPMQQQPMPYPTQYPMQQPTPYPTQYPSHPSYYPSHRRSSWSSSPHGRRESYYPSRRRGSRSTSPSNRHRGSYYPSRRRSSRSISPSDRPSRVAVVRSRGSQPSSPDGRPRAEVSGGSRYPGHRRGSVSLSPRRPSRVEVVRGQPYSPPPRHHGSYYPSRRRGSRSISPSDRPSRAAVIRSRGSQPSSPSPDGRPRAEVSGGSRYPGHRRASMSLSPGRPPRTADIRGQPYSPSSRRRESYYPSRRRSSRSISPSDDPSRVEVIRSRGSQPSPLSSEGLPRAGVSRGSRYPGQGRYPGHRRGSMSLSPERRPRIEVIRGQPYSPSRRLAERYNIIDSSPRRYDSRGRLPERDRRLRAPQYDRGRRYSSEYRRPMHRDPHLPPRRYYSVSSERRSPGYARDRQPYSPETHTPRDVSVSTGRSPSPIPRRPRGESTISGPLHVPSTARREAPADTTPSPIHRPLDIPQRGPIIIQVPSRSEAALHSRPLQSVPVDEETRAHTPAVSHIGK